MHPVILETKNAVSGKKAAVSIKEEELSNEAIQTEKDDDKSPDTADALTPAEREARLQKAYRKVDLRLVLWYGILFVMVRASSNNITNVAILNLEQGTGIKHQLGDLTSQQWAWVLSAFSYPYLILDPVSTILMKRFTPRKWMSRILLSWGVISMCQAATQSYAGLLACRVLLGLAEAGFWPSILFHLSFWYPADRTSLRIAMLYTAGILAGILSGLLAFAIHYMNGVGGLAGWRWLFLLEGLPVLLAGVVTSLTLPDYPDTASFLSEEDRQLLLSEMPDTQPTAKAKTWDWVEVKALGHDPIFYLFILIWIGHAVGGYSVALVLPTVFFELKLESTNITQLLTLPPCALSIIIVLIIVTQVRSKRVSPWAWAVIFEMLNCGCYIALMAVRNAIAKYVIICFALVCTGGVMPMLYPELIRTARGTTATAGIVGPQIYQSRFGPGYRISFTVSLGLLAVTIAAMITSWSLIRRMDAVKASEVEMEQL
ncbi:hypothetical protein LTR29_001071 [Friedmanniomyces endolithicus]|nr:hypothetical protein LTR59_004701 [Friedmanniomyces endolithicus]KAK0819187.1 hypothetical protein LTR38_000630 [Friedmanniomyces endolithicus]KAK0821716.1 hypothetical protein LTR75_000373 [Friedmanniomyces endolithicus]KAK0848082.1 hypothetical protein LTR03_005981 [Friedmanniomyces endolithicus]KAK0885494.1 hypothetical protein LTR87_000689 [Friedmanniomyces endolithicus]